MQNGFSLGPKARERQAAALGMINAKWFSAAYM